MSSSEESGDDIIYQYTNKRKLDFNPVLTLSQDLKNFPRYHSSDSEECEEETPQPKEQQQQQQHSKRVRLTSLPIPTNQIFFSGLTQEVPLTSSHHVLVPETQDLDEEEEEVEEVGVKEVEEGENDNDDVVVAKVVKVVEEEKKFISDLDATMDIGDQHCPTCKCVGVYINDVGTQTNF